MWCFQPAAARRVRRNDDVCQRAEPQVLLLVMVTVPGPHDNKCSKVLPPDDVLRFMLLLDIRADERDIKPLSEQIKLSLTPRKVDVLYNASAPVHEVTLVEVFWSRCVKEYT
jgi:hypothetical protein